MRIVRHIFQTQHNGGKWRTARVPHRCDWRTQGLRCINHIAVGERYFDSNLPKPDTNHVTLKLCSDCACVEITV